MVRQLAEAKERLPPGSRGAAKSRVADDMEVVPPQLDGLTAKERRRLRRGQRFSSAAGDTVGQTATNSQLLNVTATEIEIDSGGIPISLKEQKHLRGAHNDAVNGRECSPGGSNQQQAQTDADEKCAVKKRKAPLVAFVGQLSFDTTSSDLERFFRGVDVPGEFTVRLLTDETTGRSRGMAFVEVDSAKALHVLLSLHRSTLAGRRINIEKSAGGGKRAKRLRVQDKRERQQEAVEDAVRRVLAEKVAGGELRPHELDEGVVKLLSRRSGRLAKAALDEFCSLEIRQKLENPAAYLTKIITRMTGDEAITNRSTITGATKQKVTHSSKATTTKRVLRRRCQPHTQAHPPHKSTISFTTSAPASASSPASRHDLRAIFPSLRNRLPAA